MENQKPTLISKVKRRRPAQHHKPMAQSSHKGSEGILTKAPGSLPNKYIFEKEKSQSSSFCGCCPGVGEKKWEVYLSPTEPVSRGQLQRG